MTDFRALCVELTDCLEKADWPHRYADKGLNESEWQQRSDTIRRALESLPS